MGFKKRIEDSRNRFDEIWIKGDFFWPYIYIWRERNEKKMGDRITTMDLPKKGEVETGE